MKSKTYWTWRDYTADPVASLDETTFSSFGLYHVVVDATDYVSRATPCSVCVAVLDDFAPHARTSCSTSSWGSPASDPADLTASTLQSAIIKENNFYAFSSLGNVENNGDNSERCDAETRTMRDFHATSFTNLTNSTTRCFDDFLIKSLLENPLTDDSPLALSESALSQLTCTRCCAKQTILQEKRYAYQCGTDPASIKPTVQGSESCSFSHCLRVPASTLVSVSASISTAAKDASVTVLKAATGSTSVEEMTIYRLLPCATFAAGCAYSTTLGSLFSLEADWNYGALPNKDDYLRDFSAPNYVFWRYSIAGSDWKPCDHETVLEFKDASSTVVLEAWTRCGIAQQFTFTVNLYAHSTRDICSSFHLMWYQAPTNPRQPSTADMCAFPDSDFAPVVFQYNSETGIERSAGRVTGRVTDVQCTIKVAHADTDFSSVAGEELQLEGVKSDADFEVLQYFGVELVHKPTTAMTTQMRVECAFTFHPVGETTTSKDQVDTCGHTFALTDCDRAYMDRDERPSLCDTGKCLASGPTSQHGPYESCGGTVFTNYDNAKTELKKWTSCCDDCGDTTILVCTSFLDLPGASINEIKRCEPQPKI